jgi:hypothetical protein
MAVKDLRPCSPGSGSDHHLPRESAAAATGVGGPEAPLEAPPVAGVVARRPVLRLLPSRLPGLAAERLVVSRRSLAAALGGATAGDEDLRRHAEDRIAARLPGLLSPGVAEPPFGGLSARVPVLLPLPLRACPGPAPRPGLIGVLPLAAAAAGRGVSLPERRAGLAALGWRLGIGELDAAALRFVALPALGAAADLLLLRWSPELPRHADALRGGLDPQALVLTGCDGPDALQWGRSAGLVLFSGVAAEAMLPGAAPAPEAGS